MTITTYATLKSAIADYLERTDLSTQIVTAIGLAKGKMYRGVMSPGGNAWAVPPLRVRDMITTANITVTAGVGALPNGWLEFLRLKGSVTDSVNLEYVTPETYWGMDGSTENDTPLIGYTIEGSSIRTLPAGSDTLLSVHYAAFTAMSADSDHDWIIDNAPHVYLSGALAEMWDFIGGNDSDQMKQAAAFSGAVRGLNAQYSQAQRSGSAMIMRPRSIA